jgi:hypothetical protein
MKYSVESLPFLERTLESIAPIYSLLLRRGKEQRKKAS